MEVSCSLDEDHITSALIGDERRKIWDIENRNSYRQLSLFDDMHLEEEKTLFKGSAGKGSSGKCCLWTVMRKYRRNEHDDLLCEPGYTGILSGIYDAGISKIPQDELRLEIKQWAKCRAFAVYRNAVHQKKKGKRYWRQYVSD